MEGNENLWIEALKSDELKTTENVERLMRQQCQFLKESTGGKVSGRFVHLKLLKTGIGEVLAMTAKMAASIEPDDDLKDANELYSSKRYSFDIISSSYKFRMFDVVLRPLYPLVLNFDEGVYEDIKDSFMMDFGTAKQGSKITVGNDDELMSVFAEAVSSKKVKFILGKLLSQSDLK